MFLLLYARVAGTLRNCCEQVSRSRIAPPPIRPGQHLGPTSCTLREATVALPSTTETTVTTTAEPTSTEAAVAAAPRPFLKWAGGKGQLLGALLARLPAHPIETYYEPFLGGGAMFFALAAHPEFAPRHAVLNDSSRELMTTFEVVRDDLGALIGRLEDLAGRYLPAGDPERQEIYYAMREQQPEEPLERAARFIFLNKTCFNGLYRVNRSGRFNVPHGRYRKPRILDEPTLRAASAALVGVDLRQIDFTEASAEAGVGDLVYADPPFHPLSRTSSFTSYTEDDFGEGDQRRLKWHIDALTEAGASVMLSDSPHPYIRGLYDGAHDGDSARYHLDTLPARRMINSRGDRRGVIDELLVTNYESHEAPSTDGPSNNGTSASAR